MGDEDNFRLYHASGFGCRGPLKFRYVPAVYCIDVRGHLNSRFLKLITKSKIQRDVGLKGEDDSHPHGGVDAPK